MNQSDLKAMRERLQARQTNRLQVGGFLDALIGSLGLAILFLVLAFI